VNRVHDLVVFGATGFTGQLAARYLANRYSSGLAAQPLKWAIAGRRRAALESLRAELQLPDLPIIIADSADEASLAAMVSYEISRNDSSSRSVILFLN
jgi:short subunit dehydrogenase-like uncharacterized protein